MKRFKVYAPGKPGSFIEECEAINAIAARRGYAERNGFLFIDIVAIRIWEGVEVNVRPNAQDY